MAAGWPVEGRAATMAHAGTLARRDVPTCAPYAGPETIRWRLRGEHTVCVVLSPDGVVLGVVHEADVAGAPAEATAESLMEEGPRTYRPSLPLADAVERMRAARADRALVTTSDGRLVGLLLRADAERALASRSEAA